jgi:hypothetical protein
MSGEIICLGCGQRVAIPEGYGRNKIQCPACGVIGPVSSPGEGKAARARQASPASVEATQEQEAARALGLDDPVPEPAPVPVQKKKKRCKRCGERLDYKGECPACQAAPSRAPASSGDEDEDDDSPYQLTGKDEKRCPSCTALLPADTVLCVRCGYHTREKKKVDQSYQPLARSWETNYPLSTRWLLFLGIQGISLLLGVAGALLAGEGLLGFLSSWLFAGAALAFLLGTFDRIDLIRDGRGRVTITRIRRIGFFPCAPVKIPVRGYEGVSSGKYAEGGFWEWIIFLCLLPGVIPALIWWYLVIHKLSYHVALTQDHGHPAEYIYRGRNEEQMNDIARTVSGAAGLRWQR